MNMDQKLVRNSYLSEAAPHIIPASAIAPETIRLLVKCCPAGLYQQHIDGSLRVNTHGCLECGTCRLLVDEQTLVLWRYPTKGSGVQLRFG